jgi:hypothetical protein
MRPQGSDQCTRIGRKFLAFRVLQHQNRFRRVFGHAGGLPRVVAMAGQVQRLHHGIFGEPLAKLVGIAALLHQEIELGRAHRRHDGGLLGLVIKLKRAARRRRHEHQAKSMLVERWCVRLTAKPPHRAEAQADIAGEETLLIGQKLPRRAQQRPFGRARVSVRGTHLESQWMIGPLQQRTQLPAVTIQPPIKLAPQRQKAGRRMG